MVVFQFNHKYNGHIALITVYNNKFIVKATTPEEWDCIVNHFENLTDVLHDKRKVFIELNSWKDIPLLSRVGFDLTQLVTYIKK